MFDLRKLDRVSERGVSDEYEKVAHTLTGFYERPEAQGFHPTHISMMANWLVCFWSLPRLFFPSIVFSSCVPSSLNGFSSSTRSATKANFSRGYQLSVYLFQKVKESISFPSRTCWSLRKSTRAN